MDGVAHGFTPYPVPSGFILSYLMGYMLERRVMSPMSRSAHWGITWKSFSGMVTTQMAGVVPMHDVELVWNSWTY